MIALSDAQLPVEAISVFVQRSVWSVRRWLVRYKLTGQLTDATRSGRPAIYAEQTQLRIAAFYCQTRPLVSCGRWSLRWAAKHLLAQPSEVGASPSKSTVHRILNNNLLKPHLSRYFLHITDSLFFVKFELLIKLYANPPRHLFFFDECPGIQVLMRLVPDLQTETMKKRLEEFEYIRNGTLDVFAFLQHHDGQIAVECQADHTIDTFIDVFRRHANRFPQTEPLHYVMDNLASHYSYSFCQLVAELSVVSCPSEKQLATREQRVAWLCTEDKRIVIHFTPFHGSWLNQVEIWFGILGRKVLGESFSAPDELRAAILAFAEQWNLLLAHPFRWTYTGEDLRQKAVQRCSAMLQHSPQQINLRTLTKLLLLMATLLEDDFEKVPQTTWQQFAATIRDQSATIEQLINQEQGPKRKTKAQRAITKLTAALEYRALSHESLVA